MYFKVYWMGITDSPDPLFDEVGAPDSYFEF